MKLTSIKYLTKEGFKNAWVNRLMTLASIGVLVACMVIIGLAVLISENVNLAVGNLEKQNVVMAYMKDYNWALYSDTLVEDTSSEQASNTETTEENTEEEFVVDTMTEEVKIERKPREADKTSKFSSKKDEESDLEFIDFE